MKRMSISWIRLGAAFIIVFKANLRPSFLEMSLSGFIARKSLKSLIMCSLPLPK